MDNDRFLVFLQEIIDARKILEEQEDIAGYIQTLKDSAETISSRFGVDIRFAKELLSL
jgi:hypothetical protein